MLLDEAIATVGIRKLIIHDYTLGHFQFKSPLPAIGYPGYYHVPGHRSAIVNRLGSVIDCRTGNVPPLRKNWSNRKHPKQGYYLAVRVAKRHLLIHRMLCLAFLLDVRNVFKLQVNHKDGDKLNNALDNLEWVTNQENAAHAVVNGLRSTPKNAIPVWLWDMVQGTINQYPSVSAAHTDIDPIVTLKRLHEHLKKPSLGNRALGYPGRYVFSKTNDFSDILWVHHSNYDNTTVA